MKTVALLSLVLAAGCASTMPSELRDARDEYTRASHGLAAQLDPTDLHIAQNRLAAANHAFDKAGDAPVTRDLAYTAFRDVQLTEVRAEMIAAQQQRDQALSQAARIKDEQVRLTSAELQLTQQALLDAQTRARDAAIALIHIATVKAEPRGMVITIPGEVLFASGKHELLPGAQAKLQQVADVLSKQDASCKVVVQGYTDSVGSASANLDLSKERAESVRAFLVGRGIGSDRITAEGFGPSNPVGDNETDEGRAQNRRVEIVVQGECGAAKGAAQRKPMP